MRGSSIAKRISPEPTVSFWKLMFPAALVCILCIPVCGEALFEETHVVSLPKSTYGYRGMPGSMAVLQDGRLLLCYSRMSPEGKADGSIAGKYSDDRGKTWGEEFVLLPEPAPAGPDYYCHPSLLQLANGHLLLSYIYGSGATPLFGHNYYRRSLDGGKTWGGIN